MDELSLDNILGEDQIEDLFSSETIQDNVETEDSNEKNEEKTAEEIDLNSLFDEDPESVGSEENNNIDEEDSDFTKSNTSPNFYSSIANALVEEGVFSNLEEEDLSKIDNAESFKNLIESHIKNQLDGRQKRIDEALNLGVEPSEVQKYEKYITFLGNISEDNIEEESDQGENLRKNLIYQDYINRGFSVERATKEVEKSFNNGTDIEDAKEAIESNKEFYSDKYQEIIEEAKKAEEEESKKIAKQAEELRNSILKEDKAFGELSVDKSTRQKVYDSIMKPIYTDKNTGEKLTELQKYQSENKTEFLKNVGLVYVLTNGFKSLDGLVKGKVTKEVKRGLKELENTLNNSSRNSDGSLKLMSGFKDPESRSSKWDLDI